LLGNELAAERGFTDLAWAGQEHHFFAPSRPVALKGRVHAVFLGTFAA
jgi:hypothetical protein